MMMVFVGGERVFLPLRSICTVGIIKSKVLYQACATDDPVPLVRITASGIFTADPSLRKPHCGAPAWKVPQWKIRSENLTEGSAVKVPHWKSFYQIIMTLDNVHFLHVTFADYQWAIHLQSFPLIMYWQYNHPLGIKYRKTLSSKETKKLMNRESLSLSSLQKSLTPHN